MSNLVQRHHLDALLTDPDFHVVDDHFNRFNVFTAIGAHRAELRHSNFLARLLDPNAPHGLGSKFLAQFLVRVTALAKATDFSATDVLLADWSDVKVRREWRNIDLVVFDQKVGFVCCIENKIDSREHSDQLNRYHRIVESEFPVSLYPKRLYIYLTPDGELPTHENYVPVAYRAVLDVVQMVLQDPQAHGGIQFALQQYADLLRRYILEQNELALLCQRIYRKHRQALDAIWEFGDPDWREIMSAHLRSQIDRAAEAHSIVRDDSIKTIVRFADRTFDSERWSKKAHDWTSSGRIVLYEFTLKPDRLLLELVLGTGDEAARRLVLGRAQGSPFIARTKIAKFHRLWRDEILAAADFEMFKHDETDVAGLLQKIDAYWSRFLSDKLPIFRARLSG